MPGVVEAHVKKEEYREAENLIGKEIGYRYEGMSEDLRNTAREIQRESPDLTERNAIYFAASQLIYEIKKYNEWQGPEGIREHNREAVLHEKHEESTRMRVG